MKIPAINNDWPSSVKESHLYDRLEVGGERFNAAYATMYGHRRQRTLAALQDYCPTSSKVLDLAAASGNFSIGAAELGYQVTWNDLRAELIDYVKLKARRELGIDFVPENIFELSGKYDGAFDCVMALEVIEHVAHPDDFVAKLSDLVKPGGIIIVSTPNGGYFRNSLPRFTECKDPSVFESMQFGPNADDHIFLLYEDEMIDFGEKAGLELLRYEQFTNPLSAGHVKLRHLHKVLPVSMIEFLENRSRRMPKFVKSHLMNSSLAVYRKQNG